MLKSPALPSRQPLSGTQWTTIFILSGCFAIFSCFISGNLGTRFDHHAEVVYNQFAILRGAPHHINGVEFKFPQFQSRIFFPLLLDAVTQTRLMSASQSFIFLRIATAFFAYLSFLVLCIVEAATIKIAGIGAGALAYAMVFTFNHGFEHPTDFLDVISFVIFIGLALQKRRALLTLVVVLATLNRQTAAFAGVIWLCLWAVGPSFRLHWREIAYSFMLIVGSYAISTAVKFWFGGRGQSVGYVINGWETIPQFIDAIRNPKPYAWPVLLLAMILPVSMWLWSNKRVIEGDLRRLLWASLLIVGLSSPIAYWSELRSVFLAPMVIVTFVATIAEARIVRHPSSVTPDSGPKTNP
jgi:hypothetical protein